MSVTLKVVHLNPSFGISIKRIALTMKVFFQFALLLLSVCFLRGQNSQVIDSLSGSPVPYATISFGDGLGTYADGDGKFSFSQKRYMDVDTLFISAVGYYEKVIPVSLLTEKISLKPQIMALSEVVLSAPKRGKYKTRKQKHLTHTELFSCWLPTIESEVAVFYERYEGKSTQISKLYLPINAEAKYKSKGKGKFATFFRIQFYENNKGLPGNAIPHEKIVFAIDEKKDKVFALDISSKQIFIPETGIYASLQVLGYENSKGKLSQAKKYREVETPKGIQKISTAFRPLLPFTNKQKDKNTYVRRIFLNEKKWQIFDRSYNKNSKLIQNGFNNYGMGAEFRVYTN